jgi:hypothetical protein
VLKHRVAFVYFASSSTSSSRMLAVAFGTPVSAGAAFVSLKPGDAETRPCDINRSTESVLIQKHMITYMLNKNRLAKGHLKISIDKSTGHVLWSDHNN